VKDQRAFESAQAQKTQIRKFCNNNNLSQRQRDGQLDGRQKKEFQDLDKKECKIIEKLQ
jgi:hypothetical protein